MTLLGLATLYFVGGIILGSAAYVRGTTILHDRPIAWASLPGELLRPEWRHVLGMTPWVLVVLFAAMVGAAVLLRTSPDVAAKPAVQRIVTVVLSLGFLPSLLGAASLLFTLLNAKMGRGHDGEWLNEFHPVREAFFLAHATLFWVTWRAARRIRQRSAASGTSD